MWHGKREWVDKERWKVEIGKKREGGKLKEVSLRLSKARWFEKKKKKTFY